MMRFVRIYISVEGLSMDFKRVHIISKSLLIVGVLTLSFLCGILSGVFINKYQCKIYLGTVIGKEYLPEEIVEVEGRTEKYDKQYNLILRDNAGERVCTSVSAEVFNQVKIGDLLRR